MSCDLQILKAVHLALEWEPELKTHATFKGGTIQQLHVHANREHRKMPVYGRHDYTDGDAGFRY